MTVTDGATTTANYTINYAASNGSGVPALTHFHRGKRWLDCRGIDANYMFVGDDETRACVCTIARILDCRSMFLIPPLPWICLPTDASQK